MLDEQRLKKEFIALTKILKENEFKFAGFNTAKPYLAVALLTNSKKAYTVKIDLSSANYPDSSPPEAYIINPKPLLTYTGESMLGASHVMHTLSGKDDCVQVCHYGGQDWHPGVLLYQIIIKIRIWLEAYEAHLKTGQGLSDYLPG